MSRQTEHLVTREDLIAFLDEHPNRIFDTEDNKMCIIAQVLRELHPEFEYIAVYYDTVMVAEIDDGDYQKRLEYENPDWMCEWLEEMRDRMDRNGHTLGMDAADMLDKFPVVV